MSSLSQHCQDCEKKLGKPFREIHRWLDAFASPKRGYLNLNHRRYRHHIDGIEEVRKIYGDEAAEAASRRRSHDSGT